MEWKFKPSFFLSFHMCLVFFIITSSWQVECKIGANNTKEPSNPKEHQKMYLAVLLPMESSFDYSLVKVVPGIMTAIDSPRVQDLIGNSFELAVREYDSKCSQVEVLKLAVDAVRSRQEVVDIYIGPACSYAAATVSRLVEHWRKIFVTAGCIADFFDEIPVTRMSVTATKLGNVIYDVIKNTFDWNITAVISASPEGKENLTYCNFLSSGFLGVMRSHGHEPENSVVFLAYTDEEIKEMLENTVRPHARSEYTFNCIVVHGKMSCIHFYAWIISMCCVLCVCVFFINFFNC